MARTHRSAFLAIAALSFFGASAFSQQQLNELQLCNGGDGLFAYSDPSTTTDFVWKVFPKETLRAADQNGPHQMELNGITLALYDTSWNTSPSFYDIIFTSGMPSGVPDNIGPNLSDPNATLLSLGSAAALGIPDPCTLAGNPLGCVGGCPPAGLIGGYSVEFALAGGTGPNGGLLVPADGNTDLVVVSNVGPAGMTLTPGTGQCGQGDYTFCDLHSSNVFASTPGEFQAPTASGNSPYGGFSIAGTPNADAMDEVQDMPVEFQQPVVEGRTSFDPAANPGLGTTGLGLSSLRFSVGGGTNGYGTKIVSAGHVGEFGFVFGTVVPQLPYPGIPLFGMDILVNIADPLANTTSSFWNGTITPVNNGGPPFDDGVLVMPLLTVPVAGIGAPFNFQGYTLNFSTFAFDSTGTIGAQFLP